MRHTGQSTGTEITFPKGDELISSTDSKGVITSVNDTFCKIAGYPEKELLGQAHNIVRHADMPSDAFKLMWGCLKAKKPWLGVVKNRCKNGDHYWVNAYVMPLIENGEIKGYESVRTSPSSQQKDRATSTYNRLNPGGKAIPQGLKFWQKL